MKKKKNKVKSKKKNKEEFILKNKRTKAKEKYFKINSYLNGKTKK